MPEETAKRAESSSPWGMWIRSGTGGEGTATFHFKPKELFDWSKTVSMYNFDRYKIAFKEKRVSSYSRNGNSYNKVELKEMLTSTQIKVK